MPFVTYDFPDAPRAEAPFNRRRSSLSFALPLQPVQVSATSAATITDAASAQAASPTFSISSRRQSVDSAMSVRKEGVSARSSFSTFIKWLV
ncbi:hypothetical protein HDU78_009694 [Chytriomyces hyalinus]|nr:hypothetical protein HDU78_009694 [Chytriomyces hyalinus]